MKVSQHIVKMEILDQINEAADYIKAAFNEKTSVAIILGTGLGQLLHDVDVIHELAYSEIPHFPTPTVESHDGKLVLALIHGVNTLILSGRFHYYEGYSMQQVTFPVRVIKRLGVNKLIVSNAAGGLNETFQLSQLMIIHDHINLLPENPLRGPHNAAFGSRFPDMSEPYDLSARKLAHKIIKEHNLNASEGVYVAVQGPNLETKAEYTFLKIIGGDAVGMSTIPEIIVACQEDISCFAVSVITDLCQPETLAPLNIEKVIHSAKQAEPQLSKLCQELIARWK